MNIWRRLKRLLFGERSKPLTTSLYSVGIETEGRVSTAIITRNTPLPASKSMIFTTTSADQPSVEVRVVVGEKQLSRNNKTVGTLIIDGIPPCPRGVPQIEVAFTVDIQGIIHVSAHDLGTNNKCSAVYDPSASSSSLRDSVKANASDQQKVPVLTPPQPPRSRGVFPLVSHKRESSLHATQELVEASVLVESQKYQEALKHFETALNLDPRRADGWLNKGFAHSKLDQHFDALHCLEECIKIEPDYWEAWMLKAGTLLALKRKDEAIGSFRRVAEGTNNLDASIRSQAINAMGELELNEGRLAAADSTIIQMPGICSCHSQVLGVSEALTFRGFIRRRTMLLQRPSFAMGNLFGAIGANLNKFLTDLFDLPNSGI